MDTFIPVTFALCFGMSAFAYFSAPRRTLVHFAKEPPVFAVLNATSVAAESSLKSLVESKCPSLFAPFNPIWWLPSGHLQTFYCALGDFTTFDKMTYDRIYLRTMEGGTIGIDCAPENKWDDPEDDTPILIVKHGLTGGSHEGYIRSVLSRVTAPREAGGLGYRAVVVNFRGCAGVPITSQQMYSAGHTDDLRLALLYIQSRFPKARLIGVGFSLGANVLSRYLAEEGEHSRLSSGCAIGCPWDLAANNDGLKNSLIGTHVYAKALGKNLQLLVQKHIGALAQDPEHPVAKAAQEVLSSKKITIEQFDHLFTRIAGGPAPRWPYESAYHYYWDNSASKSLNQVRVPLLGINAADDPVVSDLSVQFSENPVVVMATTTGGGHLGWFQTRDPETGRPSRWFIQPALEWFKLTGEEITPVTKPRPLHVVDGWIQEVGRPEIGVREIEHVGLIDFTETVNTGMTQGL